MNTYDQILDKLHDCEINASELDEIMELVDTLCQEEFSDGEEHGTDLGYDDGYETGYDDGYETGYRQGWGDSQSGLGQ